MKMMNRTVLVRIQICISSNKHDNHFSGRVSLVLGWLVSEEPPKLRLSTTSLLQNTMTSCDKLRLPEFHTQINLHLGFIKSKI